MLSIWQLSDIMKHNLIKVGNFTGMFHEQLTQKLGGVFVVKQNEFPSRRCIK